jgi:hypothetical protein
MALRLLSAADVAIAFAVQNGTLRIEAQTGRFGAFASISDNFGLIEVADPLDAAESRVAAIKERAR